MALETNNLKLIKPELQDIITESIINIADNFERIDTILGTTLNAKNPPPPLVGIKGDGITDDASNIRAVISYASINKLKLIFPRATYLIKSTITIPTDTEIDFMYSTLKRESTVVFDMLTNEDLENGNTNIKIKNLIIDGNKGSRVAETPSDRFSGLSLYKCTGELRNVAVTGTVNSENGKAGIHLDLCTMDCYNLIAYDNDKTGIIIRNGNSTDKWVQGRVRVFGSITYNNLGSGIGTQWADETELTNIVSYNNGYTNVSCNGRRIKATNILTYNSSYSGIVFGHDGNPCDGSIGSNIISYNNGYNGLTITGSENVHILGIETYGNGTSTTTTNRDNIRIATNCNAIHLTDIHSYNGSGYIGTKGISIGSGKNHKIMNAEINNNNSSGIYIEAGAGATLVNCKVYNNGLQSSANGGGVVLVSTLPCKLIAVDCYDSQTTHTQESGIFVSGGGGNTFIGCTVENNKTYQYREGGTPIASTKIGNTGF